MKQIPIVEDNDIKCIEYYLKEISDDASIINKILHDEPDNLDKDNKLSRIDYFNKELRHNVNLLKNIFRGIIDWGEENKNG